jgi:hypothetical protein
MASASRTLAARPPIPFPLPRATGPLNSAERLQRIEAMGKSLTRYVEFMCQAGNQGNTSSEAKEKAIFAFYDQMVVAERQLGHIHNEFKLE